MKTSTIDNSKSSKSENEIFDEIFDPYTLDYDLDYAIRTGELNDDFIITEDNIIQYNEEDEYRVDFTIDFNKIEEINKLSSDRFKFTKYLIKNDLDKYDRLLYVYTKKWKILNETISYKTSSLNTVREALNNEINKTEMLLIIMKSSNSINPLKLTIENINGRKASLENNDIAHIIKDYLLQEHITNNPKSRPINYEDAKEILLNHKNDEWLTKHGINPSEFESSNIDDLEILIDEYLVDKNYIDEEFMNIDEITINYLEKHKEECFSELSQLTPKKGAKPKNIKIAELILKLSNLYLINNNNQSKNSSYRFTYSFLVLWGIIDNIYQEDDNEHIVNYIKSIIKQMNKDT